MIIKVAVCQSQMNLWPSSENLSVTTFKLESCNRITAYRRKDISVKLIFVDLIFHFHRRNERNSLINPNETVLGLYKWHYNLIGINFCFSRQCSDLLNTDCSEDYRRNNNNKSQHQSQDITDFFTFDGDKSVNIENQNIESQKKQQTKEQNCKDY